MGEGDHKAQSLALLAWLVGSVRPAEAQVLCIRGPQRGKAQGHLRTEERAGGSSAMALSREPLLAVDLAIGEI